MVVVGIVAVDDAGGEGASGVNAMMMGGEVDQGGEDGGGWRSRWIEVVVLVVESQRM